MTDDRKSFFQNKSDMLGAALVLTILSFFLINWGVRDGEWLYWLGTAMLFTGLLLAPVSRFTAREQQEGAEPG